jgi:hypothetical protein
MNILGSSLFFTAVAFLGTGFMRSPLKMDEKSCQKSYDFVNCIFTTFGQTAFGSIGAHQTWMKKPNTLLLNVM